MSESTIPKLFKNACEKYWDKQVAIRKKYLGIWENYTWKDFYENVKYFSLGLIDLGMEPGDRIIMIGDNEPEWVFSEFAVFCGCSIATGAFQDSLPKEIEFLLNQAQCKFAVVEDQEQVDKLLEIKDTCQNLKKVIYWDKKGLRYYDDPILIFFRDVQEIGRQFELSHPNLFEQNIEKTRENDPVFIAYTSGTTGLPKGAMLSSKNFISQIRTYNNASQLRKGDNLFSFFPLAMSADLVYVTLPAMEAGAIVNFPEEPETVEEDQREIGVAKMLAIPRWMETQVSKIQVKIEDAGILKRLMYRLLLPIGYKMAHFKISKVEPSVFWKVLYSISDLLLLRYLRDWLGLSKMRSLFLGGAAASKELFYYLLALGIDVRNVYGLSETGIISCHEKGDIDPETGGKIVPGMEVKITSDGEALARSSQNMLGYYNNPDAMKKTIDNDGWLHTGDAGFFDENSHLIIIDRVSELMTLENGIVFSPMYIENKLKFSPYVRDAVITGHHKPFIGSLISIDFPNVSHWAETHRIPFTTFTDLSQKEAVYGMIKQEVLKVNSRLPEDQRIKRFALLPKELDADDGELTRSRKLRRGYVVNLYDNFVQALYGDKPEHVAESDVKYRDGRIAKVKTLVKIVSLEGRQGNGVCN